MQQACQLLSLSTGLSLDQIHDASVSRQNPIFFVSRHLKQKIRAYSRTAHHFWLTHKRYRPHTPCPFCLQPIHWSPYLTGPDKYADFLGCCFTLAHSACLESFLVSTNQYLLNCPVCSTCWFKRLIDREMDTLLTISNRSTHLQSSHIDPLHPRFRKFHNRSNAFRYRV